MLVKKFSNNRYGTNTYIIACEKSSLATVIDPTGDINEIVYYLKNNNLEIKYILLTHGHFDHIGLVIDLKEYSKSLICIHEKDNNMLQDSHLNLSVQFNNPIQIHSDIQLIDDQELILGKLKLKIIHTPGHTPGSICILTEDYLFSGDTIFKGTIGRTDLPGGNYDAMINSIKMISGLDKNLIVYPGHGESTTLEAEFINNPYFKL